MDDKTRALVERLRNGLPTWEERCEAADTIEALETRVIGLEAMLCDAQAEIERLRAALAVVTNDQEGDLDFIKFQVRRVLAGEDKE